MAACVLTGRKAKKMNHRILLGCYPIPCFGGIPNHNFLVWADASGTPLFEINGGAVKPDGTYDYRAITGRLTAVETDYARRDARRCPEFYLRPASRSLLLLEASPDEVAARWSIGSEAAGRIAGLGLRYSLLTQNSNSVASAVAGSMELPLPPSALGMLRAPGGRRRLAYASAEQPTKRGRSYAPSTTEKPSNWGGPI